MKLDGDGRERPTPLHNNLGPYNYGLDFNGIQMAAVNMMIPFEEQQYDDGEDMITNDTIITPHHQFDFAEIKTMNHLLQTNHTTSRNAAAAFATLSQSHSSAIPISGRRSPMPNPNSAYKYIPTSTMAAQRSNSSASRLGSNKVNISSSTGTGMAKSPGSHFFESPLVTPSAPMPSPVMISHATGFNYGYVPFAHSLPTDETFSPQSPPLSKLSVNTVTNKSTNMGISASPRSLNDSMFSFRTGSLASVEQQMEKQRKRKENHNAVERRRRDMINIMISRLALLVSANQSGLDVATAGKMNKGEILEASVKRILLLHQMSIELSRELSAIDPNNHLLEKYDLFLRSLVTILPEHDSMTDSRADHESA